MFDSSTLPTEYMILEVPLNPLEQELLRIRQKHMEQLYEKKITWVEMIKHSFFFTTNQDMMKIAILNSYEQNETIIPIDSSNKANTNHITTDTTKELSDKKRAIAKETTKDRQAKLGAF